MALYLRRAAIGLKQNRVRAEHVDGVYMRFRKHYWVEPVLREFYRPGLSGRMYTLRVHTFNISSDRPRKVVLRGKRVDVAPNEVYMAND